MIIQILKFDEHGLASGFSDEYKQLRELMIEPWREEKGFSVSHPWASDVVNWLRKLGYDVQYILTDNSDYNSIYIDDKDYFTLALKAK